MKKFCNISKKSGVFAKTIIGLATIFAMLLPSLSGAADLTPRFNFLQGDHPVISGTNLTKNGATRESTVNADLGDIIEVQVYYHNGYESTTARNTRVAVSVPSITVNKQAVLTASISADNASSITQTIVDGHPVGLNGLYINSNTEANVEFVPGTLRWYPNYTNGSSAQPLPNGQTEAKLFQSGGVNIGDVNGCWQYKGYILFQIKLTATPVSNIVLSKVAKNLTTGISGVNISADPGDLIEYSLITKNAGNVPVNIAVSDDLSDILEYADIAGVGDSGVVSNGTLSYPVVSIAPGASLVDVFKVKVKNPLPTNPETGFHFDYVMYNFYGNQVVVNLPRPVITAPKMTIQKDVRDFTTNETNFVDENSAKPGDTLEYKISFKNIGGSSADNVVVFDALPANTRYLAGTTILSMNDGQERTAGDGIVTAAGINIGSIQAGAYGYIKFKVLIGTDTIDKQVLLNTGNLKYIGGTLTDTAKTNIAITIIPKEPIKPTPVVPGLPKTGAESWIIPILVVFAAGVYGMYQRRKKLLEKKLASI